MKEKKISEEVRQADVLAGADRELFGSGLKPEMMTSEMALQGVRDSLKQM